MRRVESTARIAMIVVLIALAFSGIFMTKEYVGWVSYHSGEAGRIYELVIDMRSPAFLWAGVYGVAVRAPGYTNLLSYDLEGGDTNEANLLFDCLEPNVVHEVYASLTPPSQIDFTTIQPATPEDIDEYLNISKYDSLIQMMSANKTYTRLIDILFGATGLTIPGTYTYAEGTASSTLFDVGILKDGNGTILFASNIRDENTSFFEGFNGRLYNYQMILPIANESGEEEYYFFSDPYDQCPAGEGELPNNGTIVGTVTTENGLQLEDVIISIGGYSTATDANGFYNISLPAGNYKIFAIKTNYDVYVSNITVWINRTTIHNIIMVPNYEELLTDIGPGQDDGPDQDIGPGEVPAVPLVEQPKMIEGTDFIISLNAVNRKLRLGNFLQESIRIYSFRESTVEVNFKLTGDVANLIEMDADKLLVAPNTQDEVTLTIFGRGAQGMYNGTIEITGDLNASIPIEIELISKEQLPVQALLIEVKPEKKQVHPNEDLRFTTDLKNLLTDQQYPVTLYYTVQDESGNNTLWTYSTNAYLRTSFSFLKTIKIPKDAPQGSYVIRVTATYLGFSSGTSAAFEVITPFWQRLFLGFFVWQWMSLLFLILAIIGAVWYVRKRMEDKKRFHLKVEQSQLPKPGPRSGWWGKIAESDHRSYFDLEQLKIHSIVAGSTGGGKSIAAQVIIEECLAKDVAVIVFDPTAQWTGLLRPCKEKGMLKYYPGFNMKEKDARSFNGNIKLVTNPREVINIKKYMNPGEVQIFAMNKLNPKDIDQFVANTIREVFNEGFTENPDLRLMMVYDEIHRILPKFGGSGDGFVQIERGAREFRKWGIGLMLVSQVLADFVGQIKANINTEVQLRTRDEGDLERIKMKYGDGVLKSLVKASVGSGMVQNAAYNRGRPYFVTFRPILHSVQRLDDEELEKYNKYNEEIDNMEYQLEQLEEFELDVFDMKLELKLALDKVKAGNFNMVEVYLEGIRPRLKKEWEKLGKEPKIREKQLVSEEDLKDAVNAAKKSREDYKEKEGASDDGEKKEDEDIFRKEVSPDKILSLVNGMLVISLKGLYDEIAAMKPSDYEQHVNDKKNDFASWIRDAVGDVELAKRVALKKDKEELLALLDMVAKKQKLPPLTDDDKQAMEVEDWFKESAEESVSEEVKVNPEEVVEAKDGVKEEVKEEIKADEEKIVEEVKVEESKPSEVKTETIQNIKDEVKEEVKEEIKADEKEMVEEVKEEVEAEIEEELKEELKVAEPKPIQTEERTDLEETAEIETENEAITQQPQQEQPLEKKINEVLLSPDKYFRFSNGMEIKSVFELADYLGRLSEDEFHQYVNEEKNDFANWIRGVFNNDGLADKINPIKQKDELISALQQG